MSSSALNDLQTAHAKVLAAYPELNNWITTDMETRWTLVDPRHVGTLRVSVDEENEVLDATIRMRGEHCLLRAVPTMAPLTGFRGLTITKIGAPRLQARIVKIWKAELHMSGHLLEKGSWSEFEDGEQHFYAELAAGRLEQLVDALMNAPDRATGPV